MHARPALLLAAAAAAAGLLACQDITAADTASTIVTLTPKSASAACVVAEPEPAAVRVDRGISFVNRSTVHLTLVLVEDNVPLVSMAPGDTSRPVKFSKAGVHEYYSQGCGSHTSERHTISVTIN